MAILRIDWNPDSRKIRQFGIGLVCFSALVAGAAWARGRRGEAGTILAAGAALGCVSAAFPGVGLWVYKAWMCAAAVIGTAVSYALLALIYYGMITPMALVMRLKGRDALGLKADPGAGYWRDLKSPGDMPYYERLF